MEETGKIPTVEELQDKLAIMDVLAKHSRGIDRLDEVCLKSAYWPDAEVAYGTFNGKAHDFAEGVVPALRAYHKTQHTVSNIAISLRGSDARVETYVTAYHYMKPESGADSEMTFLGRYFDRMEKRDDTWKIAHRRVVMDWNQNDPATSEWGGDLFSSLTQGGRFEDDPLYEFLE
jgi:hypothetical protein